MRWIMKQIFIKKHCVNEDRHVRISHKGLINPDLMPQKTLDSLARTIIEMGHELFRDPVIQTKYRAWHIKKYGMLPEVC